MRLIHDNTAARFLGTLHPGLVRKFGPRPSWSAATLLAYASMLRRDGDHGYIVLPWQVSKQWALDNGEAPPREQPSDYGASVPFRFRWERIHDVAALFYFEPDPAPDVDCSGIDSETFAGVDA